MYSCRLKTPKVRVGAGAFIVMMNNSFNLLYKFPVNHHEMS